MRKTARTMIIWDGILVSLALLGAYYLRTRFAPAIQSIGFYWPFGLFAVAVLWFCFNVFSIYKNHRPVLSFSHLVDFLRALALWLGLIIAFAYFTKTDYSRAMIVLFFLFSVILLFLTRLFAAARTGKGTRADKDMGGAIKEIVKISAMSSDDLALIEGMHRAHAPNGIYFFLKRLFDILGGLAGLILTLPFYLLIIWSIKKDGTGQVIIRQERVGLNGQKFTLYKFRTMQNNANLYAPAPRRNNDPRVTKLGKFLRRYSIDEWPQFWNVLRGEMGLVGPRPEMPFIVAGYNDWQKLRLAAKPGLTGLWQILGRKDRPLEENIEYDLYYIFHQSFFLDLAIIIRTIPHLLFPRGAY